MAESETRLETLEDEVRVLKGEVKRTLVDLRALLMREDSPLGEKVLTRRGSNGVAEASEQTSLPDDLGEAAPGLNGLSSEDMAPTSDFNLPMGDLPSGPPQGGPGPIPGPFTSIQLSEQDDQSQDVEQITDHHDAELSEGLENVESSENSLNHHTGTETQDIPPRQGVEQSHGSPDMNGRSHHPTPDEKAQPSNTPSRGNRVNSVYDEYRELLEETSQTHAVEDEPVGPPLDINVLSNLVYWTALAKQRVGDEQLKDILQLYIQSGHSRPELQDLLLQVSRMVDADPPSVREGPREWVDLMFHLHGILTGGFPVIKMPPIRLATHDDAKDGQG